MRRVAATVALLFLAVPGLAGVAAGPGCAPSEPPSCCCAGGDGGCGCGCGADQAPAHTPEPLAPPPQAPDRGLAALAAVSDAPVSCEAQPLGPARQDRTPLPAADLFISGCTFRC